MQEEIKSAVEKHLKQLLEDGVAVIKKGIRSERVQQIRERRLRATRASRHTVLRDKP